MHSVPRARRHPSKAANHRSHAGRAALAKLVLRLFHRWGLPRSDQATLLGLSPRSRSTLNRYQRGKPLAENQDLLDRVSHLLAIHKALRILFPQNRDLAYRWVRMPNRQFAGRTPLDVMRDGGFLGLVAVRRYLEFERGR